MMRRKRGLFTVLLLMWCAPLVPSLWAGDYNLAPTESSHLQSVLRDGLQLEESQRWREALELYEEAARQHPGQAELNERLQLARAHFDVAHRYSDEAFLKTVGSLDNQSAVDLYSEVLQKINEYYVHAPEWRKFAGRGLTYLEVALVEPAFQRQRLGSVPHERLEQFRVRLRDQFPPPAIGGPSQLVQFAWQVAQQSERSLQLPASATITEFICGATSGLDEYSSFLTGSQLDEVYQQIEGNFVGLGIELKPVTDALEIINVIRGGPAHAAGIMAGDYILGVDGHTTRERTPDYVADLLRGPEGTLVTVDLRTRDGSHLQKQVKRQHVEVPSVEEVRMCDGSVGYFKLTAFQKLTSRDVNAALWKLQGQGMRSLIVDLRGNPGGLLREAVEVADLFINKGTIVSTRGRSLREDMDFVAHPAGTWRVPLVVMIDGDSASASEIFAAAIRDHRRGAIVGQRSYGKGSVQGIFSMRGGLAGVRLTTASFFSPNGRPISHQGVDPDYSVQRAAKPTGERLAAPQEDLELRTAIRVARKFVATK